MHTMVGRLGIHRLRLLVTLEIARLRLEAFIDTRRTAAMSCNAVRGAVEISTL